MMTTYRLVMAGGLAVASMLALAPATARAQGIVQQRSLGGYGSATISRYYGGEGSGAFLPSAAGPGGFIAQRSLEPRSSTAAALTPRQVEQTMIGGMGSARTPIGGASLTPGRRYPAFGRRGTTGKGGMILSTPVARRSVMPPRLAAP
jgi:hypothetical protein